MILAALDILQNFVLPLNFLCHIIIFLGGYYVALHSRLLPKSIATCVWYIGLASLLASMAILMEWIHGPEFELSYKQIGTACETLLNICLATTAGVLFLKTVVNDVQGKKRRNNTP